MADGKIEIDTSIDTKGIDKGLKDSKSKLDKFAKAGAGITGLGVAFQAVSKAVQTAAKGIQDVVNASNKQTKAEKQLEVAAKNNPYLNSESVNELKNYAGQLQSITAVGDEELLPFMAELAAAGRTQSEIQDIMSAALDASASGAISLDSAVQSLNRSYSGEVGMLSRILPDVKNLTTEQLKNGEAVKLVKTSYDGMAENIADATGGQQKLNNAIGDFKETVGHSFNKALNPINNFFAKIIQGWADARKARQDYEDAQRQNGQGQGTSSSLKLEADQLAKDIEYYNDKIANANGWEKVMGYVEAWQHSLEAAQKRLVTVNAELKKAQDEEAAAAKNRNSEEALQKEIETRDKLRQEYQSTIDAKKQEIELRRKAGEEISAEDEALEMYNTAFAAYVKMYSDPAFDRSKTITGNWAGEAEQLKQITEYAEKAKTKLTDWDSFTQNLDKVIDKYKEISDVFSTFADAMDETFDLMSENADSEEELKLAQLEKEYASGLKSYDEYQEEKTKVEQDAAKKSYKIQLYQWGLNLAQATANTALGVVNALSTAGNIYAGIAMAAVTAALGAAQIASVVAAKPVAPSFATGGIVPGTSYSGDNVKANVNSGEMILNAQQQKQLWSMANGSGSSGSVLNMPITIENTVSDQVSANASVTEDAIRILITKQVQNDMASGVYNKQMQIAQNTFSGKRYL